MFEIVDTQAQEAVIKVFGVGGCGGNAVDHMIQEGVEGVEFICANTDAQALKRTSSKTLLQLGAGVTKGLGAGANPEIGRESAVEDRERIIELIEGADMLFLTAGMGGGTGTGAAPIVAQAARELGILTVAVVTKPRGTVGTCRLAHRNSQRQADGSARRGRFHARCVQGGQFCSARSSGGDCRSHQMPGSGKC